ncbi:MAG TPA: molybdopterin molybdotransferase MoeA [bacterium]|nr:MAG: Molybdopterin molybdenumtransferase [bacterium ADurb.Bin236]HOY61742.1 molybdopterin molybdotransferase MoeA [bacterium]HPI75095.1 molybdopterin molybdotransferase MoeA [bacterium]HPN93067.1 molybdopterin molybdotransferase MoeA [bacterium]
MLDIEQALNNILESILPLGAESVDIAEAGGRILAEEIRADSDVPYSDNSAMDGYALRAEDIRGASDAAPARLTVLEDVPAGTVPTKTIVPGTASRIMTGAPVPDGADAVLMVEHTKKLDGEMLALASIEPGANIRRAGEDIKKGTLLFNAGRELSAADIGMVASAGYARPLVYRRPVVGVISTGDEVMEPSAPAGRGKVRNSNSYTLLALCAAVGAAPKYLGIVADSRPALETAFSSAAESCDVIITTGGVSVGDFDLVKAVLGDLGKINFWKINMKPGKPLAFGTLGGKPLFGLPGNPVSTMVAFEMFVRPSLLKMMGVREILRPRLQAKLACEIIEKPSRVKIIRGVASRKKTGVTVTTTGEQGSGILMSMSLANCLIVMPDGVGKLKKGDIADIIPLDNFPL